MNKKEYHKKYYQQNKIKILLNTKRYYDQNSEKIKAQRKKYYKKNKGKINEYSKYYFKENYNRIKQWKNEHRELIRKWDRSWKEKNRELKQRRDKMWRTSHKEKIQEARHNNRAMRKEAKGKFTQQEWITLLQEFKSKCAYCGSSKNLTPDHVYPLSRGGCNHINNILPSCLMCNKRKNNKTLSEWNPEFKKMNFDRVCDHTNQFL